MAAIVLACLTTLLAAVVFWFHFRRRPKCPPGPYGLPLLGSLLSLDATSPHHSLTQLANKYSKEGACEIFLGSVRTVLLTDPRLIREALAKDVFAGRAPLYLTHGIMNGQGIICAEGELWKDQRRLLSAWLRFMGAARTAPKRAILESRLSKVADNLQHKLSSLPDPSIPVDIQSILSDYIGNTVNELVFGVAYREDDETWRWLLQIQEEAVKCLGVAAIVNFMPYIRFFFKSIRNTIDCIKSGQMQSHTIIRSIIEMRRNMRNRKAGKCVDQTVEETTIRCVHYALTKDDDSAPKVHYFKPADLVVFDEDCILDYYLDEQEKRLSAEPESQATERLSDSQMIYLLADLFGAGLDTTLSSLVWFILFMATHKDEQEAVRKELVSVCGERKPNLEDLPQLPYTRAAICESQRIRPVVPVGIPHGCLQDTMLGDYMIKKGSMVVPLQWALHNNPEVWDDPEVYRPSRFLGPEGDVLNPPHFIPFQMGKRMCPGDELARMMLFMFGSRLVFHFDLQVADGPLQMDGIMGLTLSPPHCKLLIQPLKE